LTIARRGGLRGGILPLLAGGTGQGGDAPSGGGHRIRDEIAVMEPKTGHIVVTDGAET
jgi:hypothetical protein